MNKFVEFAVPAERKFKIYEIKDLDKYVDLFREMEIYYRWR